VLELGKVALEGTDVLAGTVLKVAEVFGLDVLGVSTFVAGLEFLTSLDLLCTSLLEFLKVEVLAEELSNLTELFLGSDAFLSETSGLLPVSALLIEKPSDCEPV